MDRTTDEEREDRRLLRSYFDTQDPEALEKLVLRYRPLARSHAQRYSHGSGSEPLEDLIQVAELGLVKAIQGFDPTVERPFTAYAVPTILGEIKRHLNLLAC